LCVFKKHPSEQVNLIIALGKLSRGRMTGVFFFFVFKTCVISEFRKKRLRLKRLFMAAMNEAFAKWVADINKHREPLRMGTKGGRQK
jgi:hypothetical protein